jgi:hypothetical protein
LPQRAETEFTALEILGVQHEFNILLERGLAGSKCLNGQREKRARLLEAVEAAALKDVADHLQAELGHLKQQEQGT